MNLGINREALIGEYKTIFNPNAKEISYLPEEAMTQIFLAVDFKDLSNIFTVCKKWSSFANQDSLIKNLIKIHKPDVFKQCEQLDPKAWVFYGKCLFEAGKDNPALDPVISRIREDHNFILKANACMMAVLTPVWLPEVINILNPVLSTSLDILGRMPIFDPNYSSQTDWMEWVDWAD